MTYNKLDHIRELVIQTFHQHLNIRIGTLKKKKKKNNLTR